MKVDRDFSPLAKQDTRRDYIPCFRSIPIVTPFLLLIYIYFLVLRLHFHHFQPNELSSFNTPYKVCVNAKMKNKQDGEKIGLIKGPLEF